MDAGQADPTAGTPTERVVVGIDGSARDEVVVAVAAREAARRGQVLHIVHVTPFIVAAMGTVPIAPIDDTGYSQELLTRAREHVAGLGLNLTVTTDSIPGRPENVMYDLSEDAGLMVVGTGRKSATGMFLFGTVSLSTAAHAACPVLVVGDPGPETEVGRVVVGVDGSEHSRAAVALAAREARLRAAELVVHSSWYLEIVDGVVVTEPGSPKWLHVEGTYRAMQERIVNAVLGADHTLPVRHVITQGGAADTLVEASAEADLVVVGNRGRGGFRGKLLGSVTMGLIKRARCPVLVTRQH